MYVSAMIGERVPCYIGRHPGCPSDRMFHYHTNVVYNPDGQLVSRYVMEANSNVRDAIRNLSMKVPYNVQIAVSVSVQTV